MKDLQKITDNLDNTFNYYSPDYYDPLLEYVETIAYKYNPVNQYDIEYGQLVPKAIGTFALRVLEKKIESTEALKRYLEAKELQETITALGYDIEKFWYLLLFIHDYSYGLCGKGIKLNESPKKQITKLINGIVGNIKSLNDDFGSISTFNKPIKLVLEVKGKHKIVIDDPDTLFYFAGMCLVELNKTENGSRINESHTNIKAKDGHFEYDPLSNSIHIWQFAKMFLSFFDLNPSLKTKSKRGSTVSYNKMLLISRLIYIIGLSRNENFMTSDDTLKGYLKQYKDYQLNMMNSVYL